MQVRKMGKCECFIHDRGLHLCGQRLPVHTLYIIRRSNIQYHPIFYHVPMQFEIFKEISLVSRQS